MPPNKPKTISLWTLPQKKIICWFSKPVDQLYWKCFLSVLSLNTQDRVTVSRCQDLLMFYVS